MGVAEIPGQILDGGGGAVAHGQAGAVGCGGVAVVFFGKEPRDAVEAGKILGRGQFFLVGLLVKTLQRHIFKEILAIKKQLRAGGLGQNIGDTVDVGVLRHQPWDERLKQLLNIWCQLLQRGEDLLAKPGKPPIIQPNDVVILHVAQPAQGFVDAVVGAGGDVDLDAGGIGIDAGHILDDAGRGAVEGEQGQPLALGAWDLRDPAAEPVVGQSEGGDLLQMVLFPLYELLGGRFAHEAVIQLVLLEAYCGDGVQRREAVNGRVKLGVESLADVAENFGQIGARQHHDVHLFQLVQRLQKVGVAVLRVGLNMMYLRGSSLQTAHESVVKSFLAAVIQRFGDEQHPPSLFGLYFLCHLSAGLPIIKPDGKGRTKGGALHKNNVPCGETRFGVDVPAAVCAAGKSGDARRHLGADGGQLGLLILRQIVGKVEADGIILRFRIMLEAEEKIRIASVVQVGQHDGQQGALALAQGLGPLVDGVAQLFAGLLHQQDLIAAHVALAVEHVGDGALRDAGFPGNIFDGRHGASSLWDNFPSVYQVGTKKATGYFTRMNTKVFTTSIRKFYAYDIDTFHAL